MIDDSKRIEFVERQVVELAKQVRAPHDSLMDDTFRNEMLARFERADARLEASEARTQVAFKEVMGAVETMSKVSDERHATLAKRIDGVASEGKTHFRWLVGIFIALIGLAVAVGPKLASPGASAPQIIYIQPPTQQPAPPPVAPVQ